MRAYAPHGLYWAEGLAFQDAVYVPGPDLIFTACRVWPTDHSREPFSEFDNPTLEEMRLLAALVLPIGYDEGLVCPQPLSEPLRLRSAVDFTDPSAVAGIREQALARWRELPACPREGPYPPYTSPTAYQFRSDEAPIAAQRRIFDAIDLEDRLMSRGLRTLLRGLMLSSHPQFAEEAIYPLHVALEASFSLFRRQLRQEGYSDPSAVDAATRFEEIFGEEPSGQRYFSDYYDDRVMTQHPESRLGSSTYVPGTHGERLWLFKALREIYRYFLLQELVNPQALEKA